MAASTDLAALVRDWISEQFEEEPYRATYLGADGYDDRLGSFSAADYERRDQRDRYWYDAFATVPTDGLDADDVIDRELVLSELRGRVLSQEWSLWRRDPAVYLGTALGSVHRMFLKRRLPDAELAHAAASRLRQIPLMLAEARRNLDPELVSPLFVERARDQIRAAPRFVRDTLPCEMSDPGHRAQVAEAGAQAAQAFEEFETWLAQLQEVASGDWMLGEARYSALLRERELLGYGAQEMLERGRVAYAELDDAMRDVAARVPGGSPDWRAVMQALNLDHPPTPEAMREEYAAATQRARDCLVEHDLVPFADGEGCQVVPAPVFQRGVLAVASYMRPPALTADRVGHFFVPTPPEDATPEQVEHRLRTNSRAAIPTISAHEAYPGHHWHLSWAAGSDRPVRKLVSTSYLTEGWALYAERVMLEHGFFTDAGQELAHLNARILRAARIVVDTSLHTGQMSFDAAVDFMVTNACLSRDTARLEVRRYCSWPTQAPAYLTGAMEIERIRETWREANPGAPLKEFHGRLAGSGSLPLDLAERATLAG